MTELPLRGVTLTLPDGLSARALEAGDAADREAVIRFAEKSPDRTIYHTAPYFDFARSQSSRPDITLAEMILVSRSGNPLFALPIHPRGRSILTHYSGVLFPEGRHERTLRRSVEALAEVFAANRELRFSCVQAAVAPAYEDVARLTLLERFLAGSEMRLERTYSRMVRVGGWTGCEAALGRSDGDPAQAVQVDRTALEGQHLGTYDADVRNQIRQAIRNDVEITYYLADSAQARAAAYETFTPVHEASWRRTGMQPHGFDYWSKFSTAITDGAGRDLVVIASTTGAGPVAVVTLHLYEGRAIYWAGVSLEAAQQLRANALCLHAAMTISAALGVQVVELGRFVPREPAAKERAITAYKAQFGGELTPVLDFSSPLRRRDQLDLISRRAAHRALASLRSRP
ncbi:MAG: hypothetical protein JWN10_843 [Solirubrobacterales bacterium]|nr:hypothetical protein [Solirubrobacterales bacterium]